MEVYTHDLVILGTGLAGLRAALEAAQQSKGELNIALVSKLQLMRAHSVAAEGGTAAVMRQDEGDSYELHAWDTVKGSDFLADQNVVDFFVHEMPKEILHLDHWGIPWSRTDDGRIAQRPFGGHTFPRAVFAADKTGFLEMQTLYDTLMKHTKRINRYDEGFVTSIIIEKNHFAGLTMIDMINGKQVLIRGKALIIATGGAGQIFGFTTYSETVTGDGLAMAYRAGLALKDMEFVQFHPTGLIPSGILMTEACRGEGGTLLNSKAERFMGNYAPSKMELAPRDMVSRSEMTEIEAGRGFTSIWIYVILVARKFLKDFLLLEKLRLNILVSTQSKSRFRFDLWRIIRWAVCIPISKVTRLLRIFGRRGKSRVYHCMERIDSARIQLRNVWCGDESLVKRRRVIVRRRQWRKCLLMPRKPNGRELKRCFHPKKKKTITKSEKSYARHWM